MKKTLLTLIVGGLIGIVAAQVIEVADAAPRRTQTAKVEQIKDAANLANVDPDVQLLLGNTYTAPEIADSVFPSGTNVQKRFIRATVKVLRFLARQYVKGLVVE